MNVNFDRKAFEVGFGKAILRLQRCEAVTKEVLKDLSRTVLYAHHATEHVDYVNGLIQVLTPMNRKVAVLFFKAFGGFIYDDKNKRFVKKSKKHYDQAHADAVEFLADPHNNIWTWAERHVEVEAKPFDIKKVTAFIENASKKAKENGLNQLDVMRAVFAGGMTVEVLLQLLGEMDFDVAIDGQPIVPPAPLEEALL